MRRRKQLQLQATPELLRSRALRDARNIGQHGWRPTREDLANLRASTRDAIAFRTMARGWRRAGFRLAAIRKLAKLKPRGAQLAASARADFTGGNTTNET